MEYQYFVRYPGLYPSNSQPRTEAQVMEILRGRFDNPARALRELQQVGSWGPFYARDGARFELIAEPVEQGVQQLRYEDVL